MSTNLSLHLLVCLEIVLLAWLLHTIGQLLFRWKSAGFWRSILFAIGVFGVGIAYYAYPDLAAKITFSFLLTAGILLLMLCLLFFIWDRIDGKLGLVLSIAVPILALLSIRFAWFAWPVRIMDFVFRLLFCAGMALIGSLLFFIGQLIFGWKNEGGLRLVVFTTGALMTALGAGLIYVTCFDPDVQDAPSVWLLPFGAVSLVVGLVQVMASIFASNKRVRSWFDSILSGISGVIH